MDTITKINGLVYLTVLFAANALKETDPDYAAARAKVDNARKIFSDTCEAKGLDPLETLDYIHTKVWR